MKMNFKRIAAVMMALVLLFSLSATAFASNVYSNVIVVNAIEKPEETPAEEEVVEDEAPVVEEEPVVEETPVEEEVVEEVPAIDVEALLADVTVTVECEIICKGTSPNFGDDVQLTAVVTGADDFEYELVWEYNLIDEDEEDDWTVDPALVGDVVTFTLTMDNYMTEWRARLIPVLPEVVAE